jgi:hypothetical protein
MGFDPTARTGGLTFSPDLVQAGTTFDDVLCPLDGGL